MAIEAFLALIAQLDERFLELKFRAHSFLVKMLSGYSSTAKIKFLKVTAKNWFDLQKLCVFLQSFGTNYLIGSFHFFS